MKTSGTISNERVDAIKKIGVENPEALRNYANNLFRFSEIHIARARDLAKSGQKDQARDWYRFFRNSSVMQLLAELPCGGHVPTLRENLDFLGLECHPLDVPDWTTDIAAIRHCMTEILAHVQKKHRKYKTVRRFNTGRTDHRNYGN